MQTKTRTRKAIWAALVAGGIGIALGGGPSTGFAQKPPAANTAANPSEPDQVAIDAQRGALDRFLDTHPEIAVRVINYPPAMSDSNYLHEHPSLQAFLESHPLIKADPRAFISPREWRFEGRPSDTERVMDFLGPFSAFVGILLAMVWLIRTLIESRRWNRSFKVHEDLHAKLIEKFASGQDFSTYVQSEAGRRLLEWTPPALELPHGVSSAVNRILWSLQAGVVLFAVGLGLLLLRGHMDVTAAPPLLVFGTLGVTLGAGFILSALISYGLSKQLGLIDGHASGSELAMKH